MATMFKPLSPTHAWLRPGQRFRSAEGEPGHMTNDLTVARVIRDDMGLCHAVLRDDTGREISTFADQIQFAIEVGMLTPLDGASAGLAC
jgi:hypothetical protein